MCAYQINPRKLILGALSVGNNTLITAGQLATGIGSIRVWQVEFETSGATTITPYSNTTQIPGAYGLTAAGATVVLQNEGVPWQETLPGQALIWNSSAAVTLTGALWYTLA